jgi:hypothetical protein
VTRKDEDGSGCDSPGASRFVLESPSKTLHTVNENAVEGSHSVLDSDPSDHTDGLAAL